MIETEILWERRGVAGVVVLNRPQALNALTLGMVRGLSAALDAWEHDDAVRHIVVTGAGDKAFCAGGDIRQLYEMGRGGQIEDLRGFWREEYVLNARIKAFPKPYIAIIDGIVMGGGVGISLHGSHRVAGERYLFAMPEVGIGFFPDVGVTHALPRLPGCTGAFLAVTGERAGQADALVLGLATHAVPSADLPGLVAALEAGEEIDMALARVAMPPAEAPLARHRALIDHAFSASTIEAVIERLAGARDAPFAQRLIKGMARKSPTSMKIALAQMQLGATLTFRQAMQTEFRIVSRIVTGMDFYEGVRAQIIDKDQQPAWQPPTLAGVTAQMVSDHFAPLADELFA